jgi:hypothetical protein
MTTTHEHKSIREVTREVLAEVCELQEKLTARINDLPEVNRLRGLLEDGHDGYDLGCDYISPTEFIQLRVTDSLSGGEAGHVDLADVDAILAMYDSGVNISVAVDTIAQKRIEKEDHSQGEDISMEDVLGNGSAKF